MTSRTIGVQHNGVVDETLNDQVPIDGGVVHVVTQTRTHGWGSQSVRVLRRPGHESLVVAYCVSELPVDLLHESAIDPQCCVRSVVRALKWAADGVVLELREMPIGFR